MWRSLTEQEAKLLETGSKSVSGGHFVFLCIVDRAQLIIAMMVMMIDIGMELMVELSLCAVQFNLIVSIRSV